VGLQLVRDLVDQLHGNLTLSLEGGTTFSVTFDDTSWRAERQ
jgi:two-component sensor histidine kinase